MLPRISLKLMKQKKRIEVDALERNWTQVEREPNLEKEVKEKGEPIMIEWEHVRVRVRGRVREWERDLENVREEKNPEIEKKGVKAIIREKERDEEW